MKIWERRDTGRQKEQTTLTSGKEWKGKPQLHNSTVPDIYFGDPSRASYSGKAAEVGVRELGYLTHVCIVRVCGFPFYFL